MGHLHPEEFRDRVRIYCSESRLYVLLNCIVLVRFGLMSCGKLLENRNGQLFDWNKNLFRSFQRVDIISYPKCCHMKCY